MALGALMIKERLGMSDEETVEQVRENPYLQYFLGLSEYSDRAPFDASMMTHFRCSVELRDRESSKRGGGAGRLSAGGRS
jgi:transposase, IS5 family